MQNKILEKSEESEESEKSEESKKSEENSPFINIDHPYDNPKLNTLNALNTYTALSSIVDYQIYLQEKLNDADQAARVEYLEFSVAKYRFLIDISFVQHVISWQTPYKMPFLPEYALGVIHEQQKSIVLVSLEKWLFAENLHHEQYPLILCCAYQNFKVAFAINQAAFYFHEKNQGDLYLKCNYENIQQHLEAQKETQKEAQKKIQAGEIPEPEVEDTSKIWLIDEAWFAAYLRF